MEIALILRRHLMGLILMMGASIEHKDEANEL